MKKILLSLLEKIESDKDLVLMNIVVTKGSTPQVQGASALFSKGKLIAGTLGGGILEADATQRSEIASKNAQSNLYSYNLTSDIKSNSGAICGGSTIILLDARPSLNKKAFASLEKSLGSRIPCILATLITQGDELKIERFTFENGKPVGKNIHNELIGLDSEMFDTLQSGECMYIEKNNSQSIFLQPIYPLPALIIAGAGHIAKALSHYAKLLDFEVTVIDDRHEFANPQNIPDADHIIVSPIGDAIAKLTMTEQTFIVLVTRGHHDDSEALKACIKSEVPYIGMIGSKRKIRLMRENFIGLGFATPEEFDRVHAPIGLDINSKTVQEIAVSICAELIQVRNQRKSFGKSHEIYAIILAAGESKRMGKPKMLLPFGEKSIIEKVVNATLNSKIDKSIVVLGADAEHIAKLIDGLEIETAFNKCYQDGMLSSVQCGLKAVSTKAEAVMIFLGDQPMIQTSVINKILAQFRRSGKNILVASYRKKRGHPILIGKKYFQEILELPAQKSLKELLIKYPNDIEEVETENPEILRDIDTQEEYLFELKNNTNYD